MQASTVINLEIALKRVQETRKREKISKSTRMNFRVMDKLAREGRLKDTWVVQAVKENMSEEEKRSMDEWLDGLKRD